MALATSQATQQIKFLEISQVRFVANFSPPGTKKDNIGWRDQLLYCHASGKPDGVSKFRLRLLCPRVLGTLPRQLTNLEK